MRENFILLRQKIIYFERVRFNRQTRDCCSLRVSAEPTRSLHLYNVTVGQGLLGGRIFKLVNWSVRLPRFEGVQSHRTCSSLVRLAFGTRNEGKMLRTISTPHSPLCLKCLWFLLAVPCCLRLCVKAFRLEKTNVQFQEFTKRNAQFISTIPTAYSRSASRNWIKAQKRRNVHF